MIGIEILGPGVSQPVPRHREIGQGLAKHIIKMLSDPVAESASESPDKS